MPKDYTKKNVLALEQNPVLFFLINKRDCIRKARKSSSFQMLYYFFASKLLRKGIKEQSTIPFSSFLPMKESHLSNSVSLIEEGITHDILNRENNKCYKTLLLI